MAAANEHLLQVRGLVIEKKTSSLMAVLRNISLKHPLPIYPLVMRTWVFMLRDIILDAVMERAL